LLRQRIVAAQQSMGWKPTDRGDRTGEILADVIGQHKVKLAVRQPSAQLGLVTFLQDDVAGAVGIDVTPDDRRNQQRAKRRKAPQPQDRRGTVGKLAG
jgi:hypothetical protein